MGALDALNTGLNTLNAVSQATQNIASFYSGGQTGMSVLNNMQNLVAQQQRNEAIAKATEERQAQFKEKMKKKDERLEFERQKFIDTVDIRRQEAQAKLINAQTKSAKEARYLREDKRMWEIQDRLQPFVTPTNMQPQFRTSGFNNYINRNGSTL